MYERPDDLVPTPQPLPAGPAWERLLLENPWPLILLLGAAAVIVFSIYRRRARLGLGAGLAGLLLALAGGVWVLAARVTTDREEVRAAAAELVNAAAKADVARLDALLTDDAAAYTIDTPNGMGKSGILSAVKRTLGEEYPVKEYKIQESQAVIDGPDVARAQLRVYVVAAGHGESASMWWGLGLRRDEAGRWRFTEIRPLHPWIAAPQRR